MDNLLSELSLLLDDLNDTEKLTIKIKDKFKEITFCNERTKIRAFPVNIKEIDNLILSMLGGKTLAKVLTVCKYVNSLDDGMLWNNFITSEFEINLNKYVDHNKTYKFYYFELITNTEKGYSLDMIAALHDWDIIFFDYVPEKLHHRAPELIHRLSLSIKGSSYRVMKYVLSLLEKDNADWDERDETWINSLIQNTDPEVLKILKNSSVWQYLKEDLDYMAIELFRKGDINGATMWLKLSDVEQSFGLRGCHEEFSEQSADAMIELLSKENLKYVLHILPLNKIIQVLSKWSKTGYISTDIARLIVKRESLSPLISHFSKIIQRNIFKLLFRITSYTKVYKIFIDLLPADFEYLELEGLDRRILIWILERKGLDIIGDTHDLIKRIYNSA